MNDTYINDFYKIIGKNVKRIRKEKGVSQLHLSHRIGHKSVSIISWMKEGSRIPICWPQVVSVRREAAWFQGVWNPMLPGCMNSCLMRRITNLLQQLRNIVRRLRQIQMVMWNKCKRKGSLWKTLFVYMSYHAYEKMIRWIIFE